MGPTKLEAQLAIEKLNKAPGIDGIPAELKHRGEEVINRNHKPVVRIWEKERIPEEWKLSIVC
jgi:hypothetical protein